MRDGAKVNIEDRDGGVIRDWQIEWNETRRYVLPTLSWKLQWLSSTWQSRASKCRDIAVSSVSTFSSSSHFLPVRLIFHPKFEKTGENQMEGETERALHFLGCGRYPHNRSFSLIWTIISSQVSFIKHLFEFIKEIGWRGSTWFRWNLMFQGHEDWSVRNISDIGTFLDKSNG